MEREIINRLQFPAFIGIRLLRLLFIYNN